MPKLSIDATQFKATMSFGEVLASFHGDVTIPLANISGAEVLDQKFWHHLGVRVPGTGLPWLLIAGTYLKKGDRALVCWKRGEKVLQVNLNGQRYDRLVFGIKDAEEWAEKINAYITGC
jgi:hypothetical protein